MSLINYKKIKKELTNRQKLIAVSKGQDISKIKRLYELDIDTFEKITFKF